MLLLSVFGRSARYHCRKFTSMQYITEIPNIEKGVLYTIKVSDSESAVNIIKELAYRLCVTYYTSVSYIDLNGHIERVREGCSDWKPAAVLNCIKQNNRDCGTVIRKMQGQYNRRFVRAFIIDGSDLLKIPGTDRTLHSNPNIVRYSLESFAKSNKVPVIEIIKE